MDALHLGVILPNYGEALHPEALAAAALAAEESGLDSGWVTDHLLVPAAHAPVYGSVAEALVSLGFLAGRTRRLRLGVSALVVPQREPLLTLKQLLSLDLLSGGRVLAAVTAGWLEGEFATLGARFEGRGARLDAWLDLVGDVVPQAPGPVRHSGAVQVDDAWLAPAPRAGSGLELWVAGVSRRTLRRAARTGVWHPVALTVDGLRPLAAAFRRLRPDGRVVLRLGVRLADRPEPEARDERGRRAVAGPPAWLAERLGEYRQAGVDGFVVNLGHDTPGLDDRVRRFAAEVRPLLDAG